MMGCQSSQPRDGVKSVSSAAAVGRGGGGGGGAASSSSSSRNRTMPPMSFGLGVHVGRAGNVDLSGRKMDFLGPRIVALIQQDTLHRKATSLTLTDNLLYTLGKELTLLPELEEIDMDANRFQRLPESLTHLPNLWRLNASANPLSAVTGFDMAPRLQALRSLALRACSLSCVPARLAECVTLEELDLSDNAHMHVDAFDFAQLRYLRKLSVKNCGLHGETLPACLQASALHSLDISGNHFTFESPEFFGKVIPKTLQELHLCRMQLTSVPQAVIVLKRLYFLDLAENPIETLDVLAGRLVRRLPRVRSSTSSLVNLDEAGHADEQQQQQQSQQQQQQSLQPLQPGKSNGAAADDDDEDAASDASTGTRVSMSKVSKAGMVATVTQPLQLRKLSLRACGLRTVPRYFHKMNSLEELDLSENDCLDDPNMTLFSLSLLRVLNITGCPFAVDPSSSKNEWFDIAKLRRLVDLQWELWRGPHNASLYRTRIPIEVCGLPLERINEVALRPGLFVGDTVETAVNLLRDGYYKVDFSMDDDTVRSYTSALHVLLAAQDFFFPPEYTMHVVAAASDVSGQGATSGSGGGKGLLATSALLHQLHEHCATNLHLHHTSHLTHLLPLHHRHGHGASAGKGGGDGGGGDKDTSSDDTTLAAITTSTTAAAAAVAGGEGVDASHSNNNNTTGGSDASPSSSTSCSCCTCSELGAAHLRVAVDRYIFFLAMQAANYDAVIIPPLDVMCMHLSQMTTSPLQYREDCEAICGRILNCNYRNFFVEGERHPAAARDAIAASRKIWNLMVRSAQRELRWLRYDYWEKLTRIAQAAGNSGNSGNNASSGSGGAAGAATSSSSTSGNSTTTTTAAAGGNSLITPLPRGMASLTTHTARAAYWAELRNTDSSRDLAGVLDQAITSHFCERGAAQFAHTLEAFYDTGRCFAAHASELRSVRLSWSRYAKYLLLYAYRLSVQSCSEGTYIAKPQADEDGKLCAPDQHSAAAAAAAAAARGQRRAASVLSRSERARANGAVGADLFLLDGSMVPSDSNNKNNRTSSSAGGGAGGLMPRALSLGAMDEMASGGGGGNGVDGSGSPTATGALPPPRAASALVRRPAVRTSSALQSSSAAAAAAAAAATPRPARSKSMLLLSNTHHGASSSSSSAAGKDNVTARAAAVMRATTQPPVPTLGMTLLLHVHRTSHVRYFQTLSLLGMDAIDVYWQDTALARRQTIRAWAAVYDELYTFEPRAPPPPPLQSSTTATATGQRASAQARVVGVHDNALCVPVTAVQGSDAAVRHDGGSGGVDDKDNNNNKNSRSSSNNNNNSGGGDKDEDDEDDYERPAYAAKYDPRCQPRAPSRLVRRSNTSTSTKERRRVMFTEGDDLFGVF